MGEAEKTKAIYDWVRKNAQYGKSGGLVSELWVGGKAVICSGYRAATGDLLEYAGVKTAYMSGFDPKGTSHGWNAVEIDGYWYHVDATWGYFGKCTESMDKLGYKIETDLSVYVPWSAFDLGTVAVAPATPVATAPDNTQTTEAPASGNTASGSTVTDNPKGVPTADTMLVYDSGTGGWNLVPKAEIEYVAVPDVTGLTDSEATKALRAAGFSISVSKAYSFTVPYDCVISYALVVNNEGYYGDLGLEENAKTAPKGSLIYTKLSLGAGNTLQTESQSEAETDGEPVQ
jgi:hypothetical protein